MWPGSDLHPEAGQVQGAAARALGDDVLRDGELQGRVEPVVGALVELKRRHAAAPGRKRYSQPEGGQESRNALRIPHIYGMEVREKMPRGFK
jgi:hypothetical protein